MPVTPLFHTGLVKVEYQMSLDSRQFNIIRWILGAGDFAPYSNVDLTSLATQMQTNFDPIFAFCSSDVTFLGTLVVDFSNASGGSEFVAAGGTGSGAPPTLPIQCAAEVAFKIARRYRGGKPKSFLSGINEGQALDAMSWKSTFVTAFQNAWETWVATDPSITHGATTEFFEHVNRSVFSGHAERPALVLDPIIGVVALSKIASQRRRRGRV